MKTIWLRTKTTMKLFNLAILLKLIKKVAISSLVPRKDKLNAKSIEINTFLKQKCKGSSFELISHFNINPHRHTNVRGLHLNNYSDRQLTNKFLNYIEKG